MPPPVKGSRVKVTSGHDYVCLLPVSVSFTIADRSNTCVTQSVFDSRHSKLGYQFTTLCVFRVKKLPMIGSRRFIDETKLLLVLFINIR